MKALFEKKTHYIDEHIKSDIDNTFKKQFCIDPREYDVCSDEIYDPIGDDNYMKVRGLIHRYPDRVLLIPRNDCAVQCRFCFRKWRLPENESELSIKQIDDALDYVAEDDNIWEVILTGGEPLLTNIDKLNHIIDRIKKIDHVKVLRVHSRLPIVDPSSINEGILELFTSITPVYLVLHCNHPAELTDEVCSVIKKIADSGVVLLSQSALLREINDDSKILELLFRKLIENRVKPYYLHHCDLVPGTRFYRTSIKDGQKLLKGIRGKVSGICWPTYVLDIPEGYGKVPLGPNYYEKDSDGNTIVTDYKGQQHEYPDIDNSSSRYPHTMAHSNED